MNIPVLDIETPAEPSTDTKKVFVKTYGCQMNVYDSQRMADALAKDGFVETNTMDDADMVLLNTCHIREKAAEKVYSEIGRIRMVREERRAEGADLLIGVAGCVAQAEGQEIIKRAPAVDFVIGPTTYHKLPDVVAKARRGKKVVETDYAVEDKFEYLPNPTNKIVANRGVTSFLTVQEGCDKFCTFCVVPYTRGSEVSRPVSQIVDEAKRLVDAGVREITLLGQNVNAWHGEDADGRECGLGELLHELAKIDALKRLRYVTSHPRDMDDALIEAHRDLPILMPYLHLPVQSGSDKILKSMNRKHTGDDYRRLIDRIRIARSDIALSGDFIVGFPGETEQDFEDTMQIVHDVTYAQAYSFKYSTRPGTPGAAMEDQVPEQVKSERLQRLQALLTQQQKDFMQSLVGQHMDVLIEKPGREKSQIVGRSPWLQPVICHEAIGNVGDIVNVRINRVMVNSLVTDEAAVLLDAAKQGNG
ncbi:MAG: tRNA (N6-isopentenyl adenosine(37)-C2)-methylthiotransferase MiaB, partial [Pseudomonadota bacterium]